MGLTEPATLSFSLSLPFIIYSVLILLSLQLPETESVECYDCVYPTATNCLDGSFASDTIKCTGKYCLLTSVYQIKKKEYQIVRTCSDGNDSMPLGCKTLKEEPITMSLCTCNTDKCNVRSNLNETELCPPTKPNTGSGLNSAIWVIVVHMVVLLL
ncbi:hypothetical protein HELRODRAFT_176855 [Helobdella robusta]|uniref:Protein quiver n=1 Tax=Helobdella robusta TaxID=6412 RepID=T1FAZ3_HELRO|nr:hypothetical protein HELRODRAFT_176855 [Helobdella robusta]ESN98395.1 hypothetical protein HELRODRAFT_176855 [Helobdella robusta]